MGVANISSMPLQPFPCEHTAEVASMSRIVENVVHVGEGTNIYVATLYGPTQGPAHSSPWTMLRSLCSVAFSHAHAYRGPAIVVGDFNVDIDQVTGWSYMKSQGWIDTAAFDATRRGTTPAATCRNKTRRTFILANQQMISSLIHCDVEEHFDFDSHPLLVAEFGLEMVLQQKRIWHLPTTTDTEFFDTDLLRSASDASQNNRGSKFEDAIEHGNLEEAWRQVNLVFDESIVAACVETDGTTKRLPRGCLGRGRKTVFRNMPAAAPIMKHARMGHYNPGVIQAPVFIRRNVRQVRRLQTLEGQITARDRLHQEYSGESHALWKTILDCPGYHKGFATFVLDELGIFVPQTCPQKEYIHHLYEKIEDLR